MEQKQKGGNRSMEMWNSCGDCVHTELIQDIKKYERMVMMSKQSHQNQP